MNAPVLKSNLNKPLPIMNPNALYTIADQYLLDLNKLMDIDTTDESFNDTLEGLSGDFDEKAINVAYFIKNAEATAKSIKEAMELMDVRRKRFEKQAEGAKQYLMMNMQRTNILKVASSSFNISLKENPESVIIASDAKIPPEYLVIIPASTQVDKALLKADLKVGVVVEGCSLERKMRLDIK